jgi:hypothetical protein
MLRATERLAALLSDSEVLDSEEPAREVLKEITVGLTYRNPMSHEREEKRFPVFSRGETRRVMVTFKGTHMSAVLDKSLIRRRDKVFTCDLEGALMSYDYFGHTHTRRMTKREIGDKMEVLQNGPWRLMYDFTGKDPCGESTYIKVVFTCNGIEFAFIHWPTTTTASVC